MKEGRGKPKGAKRKEKDIKELTIFRLSIKLSDTGHCLEFIAGVTAHCNEII